MKFEYKTKMVCPNCSSVHFFTEGVQLEDDSKNKIINKYKIEKCLKCGAILEIDKDKIEKIIIEKNKIKDKVLI